MRLDRRFEVIGHVAPGREQLGVVRRQAVLGGEALPSLFGKLRKPGADLFDPFLLDDQRQQVRLGKIAVVMGDLFRIIKEKRLDDKLRIAAWPVAPERLAEMVRMIDQGKISGKMAKGLFEEMLETGAAPDTIVRAKGLEQVSDTGSIEKAIEQVLAAHPKQASDYRGGNEKVFGFLIGQIMKATQGKANPQLVNEILREKLKPQDG